jgi:hypothetical protein
MSTPNSIPGMPENRRHNKPIRRFIKKKDKSYRIDKAQKKKFYKENILRRSYSYGEFFLLQGNHVHPSYEELYVLSKDEYEQVLAERKEII